MEQLKTSSNFCTYEKIGTEIKLRLEKIASGEAGGLSLDMEEHISACDSCNRQYARAKLHGVLVRAPTGIIVFY